jgi:hypothetical protein
MEYFIVRHDGEFALWGCVVDAPLTFGMGEAQLATFVRHFAGENALKKLPEKIEHAVKPGSAAFDDLVASNRAGQDGRRLSGEELVRYMFVEKVFPPDGAGTELRRAR